MGKYERIKEIEAAILERVRTGEGIANFIYHREIAWKKIIQCLLWNHSSLGCARITMEMMRCAEGDISVRNIDDSCAIEVGAGKPK